MEEPILLVAIVGDTHGRIDSINIELQKLNPDLLIHTGDFYADAKRMASRLGVGFKAVMGNCDAGYRGKQAEIFELMGQKIYLVHGHQFGVKAEHNRIYYKAREIEADAVIFGHTHAPFCEHIDGIWLLNPGSPSRPRHMSKGSYITLQLEQKVFKPEICYLKR